ncbi:MAG: glutamate-1-semialdehyde 2,1-aminomutase [Deltaproteobacteria bacterium]|nr:glutamate-1-semialdehyde 2,1-aminomutase [Deltaproteobacteria bacterium]
MREKSKSLFEKARKIIPGGVNSPVRAGKSVGMDPPFIASAKGAMIQDADGNEYIDYVASWGPMILGHAHPEVVAAVIESANKGTSYGAPTEIEVTMAEAIVQMVPSVEMVRMVNSGTEATMSAIRLARGFTGRDKIIKFDGCYHGHADSLLVSAGSGLATLGIPGSPGVPADIATHTISLPYNNREAVEKAFERFGSEIACVILEAVPGNMGVVIPDKSFLEGIREITGSHGAILIFDEVITGFRLALGGAQEILGITPDLTCFGKIIGGGLPVGAYGGRADIMGRIAPDGDVYQAGTLSGNPLAMAAGLATLNILKRENPFDDLDRKCETLFAGLEKAAQNAGIPATVNRIGSMGCLFFTQDTVTDFASARKSDANIFRQYFQEMLECGVYLAPSPFETTFLSMAHTEEMIKETVQCAEGALERIARKI